jgi:hypothetical protein
LESTRTLRTRNGQITLFSSNDITLLASPGIRLNDVCINGGAALLHALYGGIDPDHFAIFTTFDIPRIRCNATDADLWRNTRHQAYWSKKIWILPIHLPNHWVLCTINTDTSELFLFDSLAAKQPWRKLLPCIMKLIARMVILANRHGYHFRPIMESWTAQPVIVGPSNQLLFQLSLPCLDHRSTPYRPMTTTVDYGSWLRWLLFCEGNLLPDS